jgi:hypothetical protein
MLLGPLRNLHNILTARQHPTEPPPDDIHQRVLEISTLAAGIRNRLPPLDQRTRLRQQTPSFALPTTCAPSLS